MTLSIENPKQFDLPPNAADILALMFNDYKRAILEKEFGRGRGGGRVFLVHLVKAEADGEMPHLPLVVKLAPASIIRREWQAFQNNIRDRLPHTADIRGEPVIPPGSAWGGLGYPLVGSGVFTVVSLYHYCQTADLPKLQFTLGRLLDILKRVTHHHQNHYYVPLQPFYDLLLPVNLLIVPEPAPPEVTPTVVTPEQLPARPLQPGDYVRLENFAVTKIDLDNGTVTLNLPPDPDGPRASYCVRLRSVEGIAADQQVIETLTGRVEQTRASLLVGESQNALGQEINLLAETLPLPAGGSLPNPLLTLPALLAEVRSLKVSVIHGDMNLENILVDPTTGDPSLIDFSEARQDHILHDFLRLETEVMTKLIPEILAQHQLSAAEMIPDFYRQLHAATFQPKPTPVPPPHPALARPLAILQTLRQTARQFLFDQDDCTEYYQGLLFYLLGALKFEPLNTVPTAPRPKQAAFWGAAAIAGLLAALQTQPADEIKPGDLPALPNPYRGLQAFREEDAGRFFGRERVTAELVQAMQTRPLVAVVGPSGSGKSSLVQAGLIPHLRAETGWRIAIFRPGDRPFYNLAAPLLEWLEPHLAVHERLFQTNQMAEGLQQGQLELRDLVEELLRRSSETRWLLVADQFEELFTQFPARELRQRFVDTLLSTAQAQPAGRPPRFVLALTLRADFMGQALSYRPLADALQNADLKLGPMTSAELTQAITAPAHQQGVEFEAGLVARILEEVGDEPGNLPLLEFALTQLWASERQRRLTHTAYETIGGVAQALAHHAEAVYQRFRPEAERLRRIFIQLVQPGEGTLDTRRRATRTEVGEDNWALALRLAGEETRLVVTGQPKTLQEGQVITLDTAELVHEALIQHWERLREWLAADRQFRVCQERVRAQQEQWQMKGQRDDDLLAGSLLSEAEECLTLREADWGEAETAFITTSLTRRDQAAAEKEAQLRREAETAQKLAEAAEARRRAETQRAEEQAQAAQRLRRRAWWLAGAVALAIILAVVASAFGFQATQNAETAQANADLAATRQMEALDSANLAVTREAEALDSANLAATREAEALAAQLAAQTINYAESQPDLALLLSLEAGRIDPTHASYETRNGLLTGLAADPRLVTYLREHIYNVNTLAYSPDGKILAAGSDDYTITLWDTGANQLRARLTGHIHQVKQVAFSPDSTLLVSAGGDGSVRLWDVAKGNQVAELNKHKGVVNSVAFSPDGEFLASASDDKTIILWNVKEGKSIKTLNAPGDYVYRLAFSPDGKTLASVGSDKYIFLWNVETGGRFAQLTGHTDRILSLAFSPNGQILASGSRDHSVILWDMTTRPYPRLGLPLTGHTNSVTDLAFSPDGYTLASSSWDKTIRVWDVATHQLRGLPLKGHGAVVNAVSFDPKNGQKLASGSGDSTIILWDLSNQSRLAKTIAEQSSQVWRLAFNPTQNLLASGGADGDIILWDIATKQPLRRLMGHSEVIALAFNRDGSLLASAYDDDNFVRVWRIEDGQELYRLEHQDGVGSVAFSQIESDSGKLLATGGNDGRIWLWDAATGQSHGKPLEGHTDGVWNLAFSPASLTLASTGADQRIILWNVTQGEQLGQLLGHTDTVLSVAFSPDGRTLASGSADKTIRLWDLTTRPYRQIGRSLTSHTGCVFSVAFSPDSQTLASGSCDHTIMLWDVVTQDIRRPPLAGHTGAVVNVVFSSDLSKPILASAGSDNVIRLWNTQFGQPIGEPLIGHHRSVTCVAISPDGNLLAWGSEDNTITLWDTKQGKQRYKLEAHDDYVNSVAFSPNGRILASGSGDDTVILWDVEQGKQLHPALKGHGGNVRSVAFSPDSRILASGSNDKTGILWDVATGQPVGSPLTGHTDYVLSIAFSPDGQTLASGGKDDKTVRLWDVQQRIQLPPLTGHSDGVNSIAFSPKGDILALGTEDGKIYLWDIRTGIRVGQPLVSHHNWVSKIVFSPDGAMLASIGGDDQIILWDTATHQQLGPPLSGHQAMVRDLVFSPKGQSLFSVSNDGAIMRWEVGLTGWQTRACEIVERNLTWQEWTLFFDNRPYHLTCPDVPLSPVELLNRADTFAQAGQREQAKDMFAQAVEKVTQTNSVFFNNWVCWFGSLNRLPDIILPACERAVELAPSDNQKGQTHDSRGLAYALLGKYDLAIKDFEFAVSLLKDNEEERLLFKRGAWIADLQKGRNPFDDVILNALRFEN